MRRRPEPVVVDAPLRLQRFVAGEWQSVLAWIEARRKWSAVHGDALGNPLERLRLERAMRAVHRPGLRTDS